MHGLTKSWIFIYTVKFSDVKFRNLAHLDVKMLAKILKHVFFKNAALVSKFLVRGLYISE